MLYLLFVLVFIVVFHEFYWKRRKLPPGPTPLPLIGNMHQFFISPPGDEVQLKWGKEYDGVFTFWMGGQPIVFITDYKLIMDAFVKDGDSYIDRGIPLDYIKEVRDGNTGVILSEGDVWREHRRFSLRVLRDFGLGKNVMQERVLDEIGTLFERIDRQKSAQIELPGMIDMSVGSIINALMFGYRFTDDRAHEFGDLKLRAQTFLKVQGHPLIRMMMSNHNFYKHLPLFRGKFYEVKTAAAYLRNFFTERIHAHVDELKNEDILALEPTDFVMAHLQEKKRRDQSGEAHIFDEQHLISLLFDLWVAGQETTSNTIGWAMAYLINNPHIQAKAHKELDKVIASDRLITNSDKTDLPYLSAIVNETQRLANLLPVNVIHRTTRDVQIGKHKLPKGTWVSPQMTTVLYNPEIYSNPKIFNPDRFLDSNGKLKRADELIPFSVGKRQCLGEGLARMELFLFIANLLNRYRFSASTKMPSLRRNHGITIRAEDYTCQVKSRF